MQHPMTGKMLWLVLGKTNVVLMTVMMMMSIVCAFFGRLREAQT
jgi:hypothetical protein